MKILHSIITVMAITSVSQADVLVYKGTVNARTSTGTPYPPTSMLYLVVDPDQHLSGTILFYKTATGKSQLSGPATDIRQTTADVTGGKTVSLLSIANTLEIDNDTYNHSITYFRGVNSTLTIRTNGLGNTVNFPRVFTGGFINYGALSGNGSFLDLKVSLAFQPDRTVTANNSNKTIQEVIDAISSEVEAKGYQK